MKAYQLCIGFMALLPAWSQTTGQVEPNAGAWKTWFISSGKDFRVPPPPDAAATKTELDTLRGLVGEKDSTIAGQVAFWDAGSPAYRWIDLISNRILDGRLAAGQPGLRAYTYVAIATYDATIAAWLFPPSQASR